MLLNVPVAVQTVYMNFLKGNAKSGFGFWKIGFPKKFLKVFIFCIDIRQDSFFAQNFQTSQQLRCNLCDQNGFELNKIWFLLRPT